MGFDNILIEVSVPEPGYTRMGLCREGIDEYIIWGLLPNGTYKSRTQSRMDILSFAYWVLSESSTEQATEVAEFLRNDATEAEWTLAALTVL